MQKMESETRPVKLTCGCSITVVAGLGAALGMGSTSFECLNASSRRELPLTIVGERDYPKSLRARHEPLMHDVIRPRSLTQGSSLHPRSLAQRECVRSAFDGSDPVCEFDRSPYLSFLNDA
jgi:hypothetical protein